MAVRYVIGSPEVQYGSNDNVVITFPVDDDEYIALSFRGDAAFSDAISDLDRKYSLVSAERNRQKWPQLWGEAS